MKILYITVSMPFGDYETFFIPEVQGLLRRGCNLLFVPRSPDGDWTQRDAEGLDSRSVCQPLVSLPILLTAIRIALCRPLGTAVAFAWLLRSRNPFILAKNLLCFPKALWISDVARRWNAEHIHAQWGATTGTMGMIASYLSGIPWSMTLHSGDIVDNNLLAMKLGRASFSRFIAEDGINRAKSLCGDPLPGKAFVLHSVVELPRQIAVRETLSAPPHLLCIGYLNERKGQKHLIDAVKLLRDSGMIVNLSLAGSGDTRSMLESLVAQHQLQSQVSFLGWVEHGQLLEMLQSGTVDCVALPSFFEGIPAALIEAMACGVPVIATEVGGTPELLRDAAGILVPPGDPWALAEAIKRLVGDVCLRRALIVTGRRRVEEGWGVDAITPILVEHFKASNHQTVSSRPD